MPQLSQFEHSVFSQHGEDGIFQEVFKRLSINNGYFVEFGAMDGIRFSNTYHLLRDHDWRGCYIEASKSGYDQLVENMATYDVDCLHAYVEIEGQNTLDNLLRSVSCPADFDLLSIDIDSNDYWIWDSLKDHVPKAVIIEFNPSVPNSYHWVQPKDAAQRSGASGRALVELGAEKGYALIAATRTNLLFLRKELLEASKLAEEELNTCRPDIGAIFYAYGSGVICDGEMSQSLWSGRTLADEVNNTEPTFSTVRDVFSRWLRHRRHQRKLLR